PTARILLSRLLEQMELSTVGAGTAEDALSLLRHDKPDLIFLDHMLPGMDGFEALQELKRQPHTRDIPVIMYTSQNAERYLEEARSKGAAGVIGKQIDREQLKHQLETLLAARETGAPETITVSAPIPVVEAEPAALPESTQWRKITGRLSVLENAWEDSQDEVRHLRQELAQLQAQHAQELDRRMRRIRTLWLILIVLMVVLAGAVWYQLESLNTLLQSISNQFSLMKEIISHLMTLVGR
ncbi:MAG: response regulator, partial [Gammaproteobacteria bacterium]|nr:response regulator [Gammaproteobacteria bacterium]